MPGLLGHGCVGRRGLSVRTVRALWGEGWRIRGGSVAVATVRCRRRRARFFDKTRTPTSPTLVVPSRACRAVERWGKCCSTGAVERNPGRFGRARLGIIPTRLRGQPRRVPSSQSRAGQPCDHRRLAGLPGRYPWPVRAHRHRGFHLRGRSVPTWKPLLPNNVHQQLLRGGFFQADDVSDSNPIAKGNLPSR